MNLLLGGTVYMLDWEYRNKIEREEGVRKSYTQTMYEISTYVSLKKKGGILSLSSFDSPAETGVSSKVDYK
jgi:hypothetical protein